MRGILNSNEVNMATTATPEVPAPSALSYVTEVKTFYRTEFLTGETNEKGEPKVSMKILNEKSGDNAERTGKLDGKEVTTIEKFSVMEYFANSYDGVKELIPDEAESVAMWNRGVGTKQDNKFRQILSATLEDGSYEYQATDQTYDMREDLKTPTTRRQSAFEKMQSDLSTIQLTPSMMAAFEELLAKRKAEMLGG
jgi:hypothetical protein